ncbi:hypothetical protein V5O48_006865 [Marasmius crinis-equi]|uniref:Uncharacterized protein n=1 Tax=Marasmius crinis-equi TaxID=585013 RepID=A0ABR3FID3_9AGAR
MSASDTDTQSTLINTPDPNPQTLGPENHRLILTPALKIAYPNLSSKILEAISESEEDYALADMEYHSDSLFKGVFWEGLDGRAGVLWLNAREFHFHLDLETFDRLLDNFQRAFSLSVYSDVHMIICGHDTALSTLLNTDQAVFEAAVNAIIARLQIPVVCAENIDEAARAIVRITSDLHLAITSPDNVINEYRNTYARLLMSVPRMDVSRTETVMASCPTPRSLWHLLKSVEPEVVAGALPLNTTLFTRDQDDMLLNFREQWVENLFRAFCISISDEDFDEV